MGGSITRGLLSSLQSIESKKLKESTPLTPLTSSTLSTAKTSSTPLTVKVSNPTAGKLAPLAELGAQVTTSNIEAIDGTPDVIILCVKPWYVEQVITELKPHIDYSRTEVAVVAAGIPLATIAEWLRKPSDNGTPSLPPYCISMPNTAVSQRQSMTFQVDGSKACPRTLSLFSLLGTAMLIEEKLLPAATSLASCGIAYAMRYVRAAMEGGVELGFRATAAQEIIVQTLLGAASLLSQPGAHPESEIDKVTTPGGITIRGLNAMEHSGFTSAVINGLKASCKQA